MMTGRAAHRRGLMRAAAASAAALLALALLAWAFNPGPHWRIAETQQADGNVLFEGDPVPATDAEAMGELLVGGAEIEWRGHGDLRFLSPGNAVLSVAPGTVLTLPAPPPRFFGRTCTARLAEGRLFFLAGPRFRGARLVVTTPARTFTATGERPLEIAHDPARGTRVIDSGADLDAFAQTARPLLAGANAR